MDPQSSQCPLLKAKIAQKGYINVQLLQKYHQKFNKDLLQSLSAILQIRKGSSQTSLLQIVSLQISQIYPKEQCPDLKNMLSSKKTQRSQVIANIMLPSPQRRLQIEAMRSNMIKVIRKNGQLNENQLKIVLEVYNLLNFGTDYSFDVKGYVGGQNLKELKQKLTSLKKMMGGSPQLQFQEKQEKKKAYLRNLQFRELMGKVCREVRDEQVGRKLEKILQVPKNKKWIGCRFHKLLLQNNWNCSQIQILSDALRGFMISNNQKQWKNIKKVKSSLKILIKNLQQLTSKNPPQSSQSKVEESERNISEELQSLISLDDSFSSASLNIVMDGDLMEFEVSEGDFV